MLKDVWRKFGVKALLVVCSVLLLAGVAIAAPALQAQNGSGSSDSSSSSGNGGGGNARALPTMTAESQASIVCNDVTYNIDPNALVVADSTSTSSPVLYKSNRQDGSIGVENLPLTLYCKDSSNTWMKDQHYRAKASGTCTEVGTATALITIMPDNPDFAPSAPFEVSYKIKKQPKTNIIVGEPEVTIKQGGTADIIYDNGKGTPTLTPENLQVVIQVNIGGELKKIILGTKDYKVDTPTPTSVQNQWAFPIRLKNFSDGESENEYTIDYVVNVRKNVANLKVYYKNTDPDSELTSDVRLLDKEPSTDEIIVMDGNTDVTKQVGISIDHNTSEGRWHVVLTGGTGATYAGKREVEFRVKQKVAYLGFITDNMYFAFDEGLSATDPKVLIAKEKKSAIVKPKMLNAYDIDKKIVSPVYEGVDYVWKSCVGTRGEGTTAGEFILTVESLGTPGSILGVRGAEWEIQYYIRRSLADAKAKLDPPSFVYNGKEQVPTKIQIWFEDHPEYILRENEDYTVSYTNILNGTGEKKENDITNAGSITISVTGKDTEESKLGYYGTVSAVSRDLTYKIEPYVIDNNAWKLSLLKSKYMYTGESLTAEVIDNSMLDRKSQAGSGWSSIDIGKQMVRDRDYEIKFERLDGSAWDGTEDAKEVGKYKVIYDFKGNYADTDENNLLSAEFEIYTYALDTCHINIKKCSCGMEDGKINNHIYNGQAHEPTFEVRSRGGELVPENAYKTEYVDNVDASRKVGHNAKVIVRNPGDSTQFKSQEFVIEPLSLEDSNAQIIKAKLDTGDLNSGYQLSTKDGNDVISHDYVGKWNLPDLKTVLLDYHYQKDDREIKWDDIRLEETVDYEVKCLIDATSNKELIQYPFSNLYPKIDSPYKFKIEGKGNYTGSIKTDAEFYLNQKDIKSGNITTITSIDYDEDRMAPDKFDATDIKNYIYEQANKNKWITDDDFTDPSTGAGTVLLGDDTNATVDYRIEEVTNTLGKDGTITLKITGNNCYTGDTTIKLNVGRPISNATVYEEGTICYRDKDTGQVPLTKKYSQIENNKFSINFLVDEDDIGVCLKYPESGSLNTFLPFEEKYRVDWGDISYPSTSTDYIKAKIKLIGINGYYGSVELTFDVYKRDLNSYDVVVEYEQTGQYNPNIYTYTGLPHRPRVMNVYLYEKGTVKFADDGYTVTNLPSSKPIYTLKSIKDDSRGGYEVSYDNNINANEWKGATKAKIVITGLNGYEGVYKRDFTINRRSLKADETNPNDFTPGDWLHATNFEGKEGKHAQYKYQPSTKDSLDPELTWPGVCPQIGLEFNADGKKGFSDKTGKTITLERGKDFYIDYENQLKVGKAKDTNAPAIIITAVDTSNFKGTIKYNYDIIAASLKEDCYIILDNDHPVYTGSKIQPSFKVYQRLGEENDPKNDLLVVNSGSAIKQYEVVDDGDEDTNTFVSMAGTVGANVHIKEVENGNYQGELREYFTIVGNLSKDAATEDKYSWVKCNNKIIDYIEPMSASNSLFGKNLVFSQKTVKGSITDRIMQEGQDYTITSMRPETIGVHNVTIAGTQDPVDPLKPYYFIGSRDMEVVVRGNLNNTTYIKYTGTEIPFGTTEEEFKNLITISYGSNNIRLVHEKDYVFVGTPNLTLGSHSIQVEPSAEATAKGYLTGSLTINYKVKESITKGKILYKEEPVPDDWRFFYAHGDMVVNPERISVQLADGSILENHKDIVVEIQGGINVKDVSKVVIKANSDKFTGEISRVFSIDPFNLHDAAIKGDVTITYANGAAKVTYTGDEVMPEIASIVVSKEGGGTKELELGTDYQLVAGPKEINGMVKDHVNYTTDDKNKPTFVIRRGTSGNYETVSSVTKEEWSHEYVILQKKITDPDVVFEPIADQQYQNGRDIKPVPLASYNARSLVGIPADTPYTAGDFTKHFTYAYGTDTKNVGAKAITIQGVGNFYGTCSIPYNIVPYDLSSADTELIFTNPANPVYDGHEQHVPFELKASGDVIGTYNGTELVSNFMKPAPTVEFKNAVDAGVNTATVTVTMPEGAGNYVGSVSKTFSIDPASILNSIRFMYFPATATEPVNLKNYKLNLKFDKGNTVKPLYCMDKDKELNPGEVGIYYANETSRLNGTLLVPEKECTIEYMYVEPDTDDTEVREEYRNPDPALSYAGKVKVTITGLASTTGEGNYKDSASFWYYIGDDISDSSRCSLTPSSTVYNAKVQKPKVTVDGVEKGRYKVVNYKHGVGEGYRIGEDQFIDADTYYVRVEGDPTAGTYASKPQQMTYVINPRPFSSSLLIDGFKKEYAYTGSLICPVGIAVTDYIDDVKYKLTENDDYTLTYTNNLNAGAATITVTGQNNFRGIATARFTIISSTISNGNMSQSGGDVNTGSGHISGAKEVTPEDVILRQDSANAMYYTGSAVYPGVTISGMTENQDYTVTYSNNVNVGTGTITIKGIGNNSGTITKTFRIIAQLSNCTIAAIPDQEYTGYAITPALTITCGNVTLSQGTDYTATYTNNINIGTATVTVRPGTNSNYVGTATATFNIGNNVGTFVVTGYAPSYTYTGYAITPGVVVQSGSDTLRAGIDYNVSYANNINAGTATITVQGMGKYSGTQSVNFVIEAKSIAACDTTEIPDRVYTGDAYTPTITVSDGTKTLTNGIDYTVTYSNNTNPGMATIVIQGLNSNYSGTKIISFRIAGVAVSGLKASSVKFSSMKLSWTKQGYADGYQICNSKSKVVKNVKTNKTTITGLSAGKTYKYKVRSYINNADGTKSYGAFSKVVSATTKLKTPSVKISSTKSGQARIKWSKVSGATGYQIYYKTSAKASYKKLKTINNAKVRICTVRGLKSGDRCYFRVRAFRKSGSKKVYSSFNPLKVITIK